MSTQPQFEFDALDTARLLRALSWSELADKALLSRAAIAKIRKGTQPTPDTVAALSEALSFPDAYFYAAPPAAPSTGVLHYRKKARAPKKRIAQLMAHASLLNKLVEHLATQPGFPRDQMQQYRIVAEELHANDEQPTESVDIEATAVACRKAWGIGEQEPIEHACAAIERAGALVATFDAEDIAIDGFSWRHKVKRKEVPLLMYYRHSAPSRVRFSLLHEAGHLVLHQSACDGDEHKEREANRFASAMLLPPDEIRESFPRRGDRLDWDGLVELKQKWGASIQAIIVRAKDLGIIGAATYRWAFVHINQRGWKRQEPGEPDEAEAPTALKQLVDAYCQKQSISLSDLAETLSLPQSMIERLMTA